MITDEIFNLEHTEDFLRVFRQLNEVGWQDFLDRLKMREALQIASATDEEKRTKVHVRVLLIEELSNLTKNLLSLDKSQ